jgi:H+/Cl- antiporter ClcA
MVWSHHFSLGGEEGPLVPLMSVAQWLACLVLGLAGGMMGWVVVRVIKYFDNGGMF